MNTSIKPDEPEDTWLTDQAQEYRETGYTMPIWNLEEDYDNKPQEYLD